MKIGSFNRKSFYTTRFVFFFCFIFSFGTLIELSAQIETAAAAMANDNSGRWVLVIHGGAGGGVKGTMAEEKEKEYLVKLDEALNLGAKMLAKGGTSLDAVEAVIRFMENCPLFNAGVGAVLNEEGRAELDAAIMDGQSGMAGAVAGVSIIKNPISAARRVMEKSNHVLIIGKGAEIFAKKQGVELVEPAYFITPERQQEWEKWKSKKTGNPGNNQAKPVNPTPGQEKHGTVGAVALDQQGNLAAGTSTGGMMGKMVGRVGDTPIIGAGTYANNKTCAVSATGYGEYFMRDVVAYDLSAMMEYSGITIEKAGQIIIMDKLTQQKANGGLIAVDKDGNICLPFNTNAMFRGFAKSSGEHEVAIY
jgi:beta-aspartyl-peptidase (threonine type)